MSRNGTTRWVEESGTATRTAALIGPGYRRAGTTTGTQSDQTLEASFTFDCFNHTQGTDREFTFQIEFHRAYLYQPKA